MSQPQSNGSRVEREARLRWVPIPEMKISPTSQRKFRPSWANYLEANLDLEQLGTPTVSHRGDWYYILDGQHRIEALKQHGYGDQQIQCWNYEDLTEDDEAEIFLKLNDRLTVRCFDKFTIGVQAGRSVEADIDRIVRAQNLLVSEEHVPGAIGCVAALQAVYKRSDGPTLGRTLRIIRDAYGDPGFQSSVIQGIGMLCQRYNGQLPEDLAKKKLAASNGGVNGLLAAAERMRHKTGHTKTQCIAAAAIEMINQGKDSPKLSSWWR